MFEVSIVRAGEDMEASVHKALSLIHWNRKVKHGGIAVVKPNMGNLEYVPGVVTNPVVLSAVVSTLRDKYSEVIVGESDGMRYSCDEAFLRTGFRKVVENSGGIVVNFSREERTTIEINGLHLKKISLPRVLVDADLFITVPVIKTHETTLISCAIKNQFGCIPDSFRILLHEHIHEVLVDVNIAKTPDLVVTDGTICMEGNGPIHGPPKPLGIILASDNILANDLVVTKIMKFNPGEIEHLELAKLARLGPRNLEEIIIYGMSLENFENTHFQKVELDAVARAMIEITSNPTLTELFILSPLFEVLNNVAWTYRKIRGRTRRVGNS